MIIVSSFDFRLSVFEKIKTYNEEISKNEIHSGDILILLKPKEYPTFFSDGEIINNNFGLYDDAIIKNEMVRRAVICTANLVGGDHPLYKKCRKAAEKELKLTNTIGGSIIWNVTINRLFWISKIDLESLVNKTKE